MNNRWHMNRIGFVNFWLYDEETFEFADGKMLLRGQNGSGKSITTQSFIPFILDGDRAPSRLDPFGSSDRKMEYYFLGEGDKDDVTGYLFLEFKREDTKEYRTIGIGQRAQRGKPMGFWGFAILDGRRIGYDIHLYQEIGSTKLALTKQELKKCLGEDAPFTEVQKEYMRMVNKYIFGFPRMEQYEQFIKLLIKVRAPKLSKEFKPTRVYDILNDSLQTLSDEDLRAMVDAMEKMDDIQNRLKNLHSTFKDLQMIRTEYGRYNKYILAKKAQAYLEQKLKTDEEQEKYKSLNAEIDKEKEAVNFCKTSVQQLRDEIELLVREKDTLDLPDMESLIDKISGYEDEKRSAEEEKKGLEQRIEERRQKIRLLDSDLRKSQNRIEEYDGEIQAEIGRLNGGNEAIDFDSHHLTNQLIHSHELEKDYFVVNNGLKELEKSVDNGIKSLAGLKEATVLWNQAEEEKNELALLKEETKEKLDTAQAKEDICRDQVIEQFYIGAENNKEMLLQREELEEISHLIQKYCGSKDLRKVSGFLHKIWESKKNKLAESQIKKKNEREVLFQNKKAQEEELAFLLEMKEPSPVRKEKIHQARAVLNEKNIRCMPFYQAVDFAGNISSQQQDLLETQLLDAGLLDALVVAKEDYDDLMEELCQLSDVLIGVNEPKETAFPALKPADVDEPLRQAVWSILTNIGNTKDSTLPFVICEDGYYRNGMLEGYSQRSEQASFIGVLARENRKNRLIKQKQEEIEQLTIKMEQLDQEMMELKNRVAMLQREYDAFPGLDLLDQAVHQLKTTQQELLHCSEKYRKKEEEALLIAEKKKICEQDVINTCKHLPYTRTVNAYQEIKDEIREYRDALSELNRFLTYLSTQKMEYRHIEEKIHSEEGEIDHDDIYYKRADKKIKELEMKIGHAKDYLNQPEIQQKINRLKEVKTLLYQKNNKANKNETKLAVHKNNLERLTKEVKEYKESTVNSIELEQKLKDYFEEELALDLVLKKEEQEGVSILEAAREAAGLLKGSEKNKSISEMVSALYKCYQMNSSNLTGYGTALKDCFEDDAQDTKILRKRLIILSTWQGKKLYFEQFYTMIETSIESMESLIRQRDRELFEDILADTLSRKLNNRIAESRKWIHDMSMLMKEMDTSMALTFSLEWKPKSAESDKELDTAQLEKLLGSDKELLSSEDIEKLSAHFRNKIHLSKQMAEENNEIVNYADLVREALDYRKWFEFRMYFYRNNGSKKELTNSAFNRFSGGEKAMAMYVPLFAAVNAQYKKSEKPDHPRIIALDEAFAGVDDKNISSMFALVQKLEFDYIMNSQALWGCYDTVKSLRIAELLRPANSSVITVIYYNWNGQERVLDDQ